MTTTDQSPAAPSPESLASRLDRAEKELKYIRYMILAVGLLAVSSILARLDKPTLVSAKLVVAESLGVKNAQGDIVASVGTSTDGTPSITLADGNKKIRLMMSLNSEGEPALSLIDSEKRFRAVLSLNHQNDPTLSLFDPDKVLRAGFSIDTGGHLFELCPRSEEVGSLRLLNGRRAI